MLGEKNKIGKSRVVTVFTLFLLFFMDSNISLAEEITSIKELKREIKKQEKEISSINANLSVYKKKLNNKKEELIANKDSALITLRNSEDIIKKYNRRITKLEREAGILQEQISSLKDKNSIKTQKFEDLNILSKSMERSDHNDFLKSNESEIALIQLDLDKINKTIASTNSTLSKSKTVYESQKKISDIYNEENNPDILKLNRLVNNALTALKKVKKTNAANVIKLDKLELTNASKKSKVIKADTIKPDVKNEIVQKSKPEIIKPGAKVNTRPMEKSQTWVYIISGKKAVGLGFELGLRDWIISFGAKYIETDWGKYSGKKEDFNSGFVKRFKSDLGRIPENSNLILIGHGLGGGAAILAATTVAYEKGRVVDFLAVLDPVGENKLRANIVYSPSAPCTLQDNNFGRVSYFACLDTAKPRIITSNVKAFYNRWQKDRGDVVDNHRQYSISDGQGNVFTLPSSTGKFLVDNGTKANQKRFSKMGWSGKNKSLIGDASKELTNILAPYLQ